MSKISLKLFNIKNKLIKEIGKISNYKIINIKHIYRFFEQEHLKRVFLLLDIDCVFDVGANNGQYAKKLRRIGFKGLIISFEPNPEVVINLKKLAEKDPRWIVEDIALSNKDGEKNFNIMESAQFSSLSTPKHDETSTFSQSNAVIKTVSVKTETLNSSYKRLKKLYSFKNPFLKLDSQGSDYDIVSGGEAINSSFAGLQSELSIKKIYQSSIDFRDLTTYYENLGFFLSAFVPNNAGHFPELIEIDCIMLRNDLKKNVI